MMIKDKELICPESSGQMDAKPHDKDQIVADGNQNGLHQAVPQSLCLNSSQEKENKKKGGERKPKPADEGCINKQRDKNQEKFPSANALFVLSSFSGRSRKKGSNKNRES